MPPSNPLAAFASEFIDGKPAEPAAPAPESAPAAAPPLPAPVAAPPKAKKPSKPVPAPAPMSDERVVEIATQAATQAAVKAQQAAPATGVKPFEMSAEDRRNMAVLVEMEKLNPDSYRDMAGKYERSVRELAEYQGQWQAANPGKKFDREGAEHNDFYERHPLEWEGADFNAAEDAIARRELLDSVKRETQAEVDQLRREIRLRDEEPVIQKDVMAKSREVFKTLVPEMETVIKPDGTMDAAQLETLRQTDPITADMAEQGAAYARTLLSETRKLMTGLTDFNPANRAHGDFQRFTGEIERNILALPKADQMDADGRRFVPFDQFAKLPKAELSKVWTLTSEHIEAVMAKRIGEDVAMSIVEERAKFNRNLSAKARREGANAVDSAQKDGNPPEPSVPSPSAAPNPKPFSPEGHGGPSPAPPANNRPPAPDSWAAQFLDQ